MMVLKAYSWESVSEANHGTGQMSLSVTTPKLRMKKETSQEISPVLTIKYKKMVPSNKMLPKM